MIARFLPPAVGVAALAMALTVPQHAAAQGRGRPKGKVQTTTAPAQAPGTPAPAVSFRQFGAWLDDASAPTPGEGRTGIGVGYWRMSGGSQLNVPMLDVGYGLTTRVQIGASVPFYRSSFDGTTARGLDDMYLSAKITAIDPANNERQVGVAVSPVLEVLSAGVDDGRVHFALPVSVEWRRQPFRVYGSGGYFSRGSVFTGGAVEWAAASGLMLTGALTQSYSTKTDPVLDSLGIGRQRMDVTASVAYPMFSTAAAYVSVGRSLTSLDEGGTSLGVSGGLSVRFAGPATP